MGKLEASYTLSFIQQGMVFHHLSTPGSGVDVEQLAMSLGGIDFHVVAGDSA